jgi:ABC-type dipeptide/oligopeptide/nickel transport system ATPase component
MDFRAGRWGETPEEIVRRESSAGFPSSEQHREGDSIMLVFRDMAIITHRCDIVYVFSAPANPGLISGEYQFHDFTHALKKQLTVTLESKYGQAVEHSDDRQVYETPRTRIILDLKEGCLIHEKK